MENDGYTRITLRIPDALHAQLASEAARTSKSMNAEIISRLANSFEVVTMSEADLIASVPELQRLIQRGVERAFFSLASQGMLGLTDEGMRRAEEKIPGIFDRFESAAGKQEDEGEIDALALEFAKKSGLVQDDASAAEPKKRKRTG